MEEKASIAPATVGAESSASKPEDTQQSRVSKGKAKLTAAEMTVITAVYLAIAMTLFWPITVNITSTVANGAGGAYQGMWGLWWFNYATFNLHAQPYFTRMLYYPIGVSIAAQDIMPLAAILTAPLQQISLPLSYNILFLLAFALSGITMFALAFFVTSSKSASFLAGIIYSFSPFHIAQSYMHLQWTSIEFIPLVAIFTLLLIKDKKPSLSVGLALSFTFAAFMGGIGQGAMSIVLIALVLIFYLSTKGRPDIINRKFAVYFAASVILILILSAPLLMPILGNRTGAAFQGNQALSTQSSEYQSESLVSFFLPSYLNSLFNAKPPQFYNALFAANPYDKTAYLGYSVLALSLIGLYYDYKRSRLKTLGVWLFVLLVSVWLSLGPYLQIGAKPIAIPGIYIAYQNVPILNVVDAPAAFDIMVTMSLAIFAAYGFKELLSRSKLLYSRTNALYALVAVTVIVLAEYAGAPPSTSFANAMFANAHIPKAYYEIGGMTGNFTLLILPNIPNATMPDLYPAMESYYQTAFKRPMVGGYTSPGNYTQFLSVSAIPLDVAAAYLEHGEGLTYASPISENYTNVTLFWLAAYHTAFVSIVRQAYNQSELMLLASYLSSVFGGPVYQSNTTIVFSTSSALENRAAKSELAYTSGTWLPGWNFCTSQASCNATLGELWWGNATRGITIYEPSSARAKISFDALSYSPSYLYIYRISNAYSFNPRNATAVLPINQTMRSYSFNVTLQQGINQIIISMQPQEYPPSNPYINYGIMNITISS
ncbi:MAG: hypothetical protein ACP5K9_02910 [Candidatus Micrarchaeia archaeon]